MTLESRVIIIPVAQRYVRACAAEITKRTNTHSYYSRICLCLQVENRRDATHGHCTTGRKASLQDWSCVRCNVISCHSGRQRLAGECFMPLSLREIDSTRLDSTARGSLRPAANWIRPIRILCELNRIVVKDSRFQLNAAIPCKLPFPLRKTYDVRISQLCHTGLLRFITTN